MTEASIRITPEMIENWKPILSAAIKKILEEEGEGYIRWLLKGEIKRKDMPAAIQVFIERFSRVVPEWLEDDLFDGQIANYAEEFVYQIPDEYKKEPGVCIIGGDIVREDEP